MSLKEIESIDEKSKEVKKQSWFRRQRQSLFSRSSRKSRKKSSDLNSISEADILSTSSIESPKFEGNRLKSYDENSRTTVSLNSSDYLECPLCLWRQPSSSFAILSSCHHKCCASCLRRYLAIEITENRINLSCPECPEKLTHNDVQALLRDEPQLLAKWEEFLLRRVLSVDPDCRWCPAPDCGYAVVAYGCASCPRLTCERPDCKTEFCYHCRQVWHHNQTCDSAHLQRTKQLRRHSNPAAFLKAEEIKPCPKCGAFIVKVNDGSCNHMTCTVCEAEFCWLCLQEISDLHYLRFKADLGLNLFNNLSPSGCTFWGKKQWSRKKQVLWQLGLLVGAPLGIGLVAGIALPVITFGLPVLAARKIRAKCDFLGLKKRSRNALVVAGVMLTVPFSPIVAALAVGLGVPILLLYVYCVVPFSLCRNGTYGMRGQMGRGTGSGGLNLPSAFRLDIGGTSGAKPSTSYEDNYELVDPPGGAGIYPPNLSIGEPSVGGLTMGSLNLSHASNLDKAGRAELDSASMRALAGSSITGSISGVSWGPNIGRSDSAPKETDQASIKTQISSNSAPGVTSVQVHVAGNPPDHNLCISKTGKLKKTYSAIPPAARKKTHFTKRSSSTKNPIEIESAADDVSRDFALATKSEGSSPLTIVDECQVMLVNETLECASPLLSEPSSSALDSGGPLLLDKPQEGATESKLL